MFQTKVNRLYPVGVAGDFASANPQFTLLSNGKMVAGADGVQVGLFAWLDNTDGTVTHTYSDTGRLGFCHRLFGIGMSNVGQQASMIITEGRAVPLSASGDFFASIVGGANPNDLVLASKTDGTLKAVARGTDLETETGHVDTGFIVASLAESNLFRITKFG